ncbi:MAG TPA: hypothetical protein VHA55_05070 [Pseudorhodoplanes sp.]|nr:hypothetical protein [Pseudorhodoplanes sp.]
MLLFYLEDRLTGETRNMAAPDGTTEAEVRAAYGGIWLDSERVTCAPPCRIGKPGRARVPRKPTLIRAA